KITYAACLGRRGAAENLLGQCVSTSNAASKSTFFQSPAGTDCVVPESVTTNRTCADSNIVCKRRDSVFGSKGKYAAPAFRIARAQMGKLSERFTHSPTSLPSVTPKELR